MKPEADKLLNQLVVAVLTVFIIVILLFGAFVLRHLWLQQQIAQLNSDVQANLEDLEEVTGEIERELEEISETENPQTSDSLEAIADNLGDVTEQLDAISEDVGEVALALEPQPEDEPLSPGNNIATPNLADSLNDQRRAFQDQLDQVFTILAILLALASIAIAALLALAIRIRHTTPQP